MGRDVYEAGHSMMSEISSRKSPGTQAAPLPAVSVVIPVLNEAGNILPLVNEIIEALSTLEDFEIICVDDGSTDETPNLLADLTKPSLSCTLSVIKNGQDNPRPSGQAWEQPHSP